MNNLKSITRQELAYNYHQLGFYLTDEKTKKGKILSIEETIFLMSFSKNPRVKYGAFPILYRWGYKINTKKLYELYSDKNRTFMLKGIIKAVLPYLLKNPTPKNILAAFKFKSLIVTKINYKYFYSFNNQLISKYIDLYGSDRYD